METLSLLCFNKTHFVDYLRQRGHHVVIAAVPEEHAPGRHDAWSQKEVSLWYRTGEELEAILGRLPAGFKPDRIVYFDDSNAVLRVSGIERAPVPTLFYSVDAHIHHSWHSSMAGMFDQVLVAQKDYLPSYERFHPTARWFPLWAPKIVTPQTPKKFEACFRGSLDRKNRAKRVEFLEAVATLAPLDMRSGPYEEAFSTAKIIVNESIHDDLNFRVFEGLSCGGLLLTPRIGNGLLELFGDKKELVSYERGNAADAAEKIRYYLSNDTEREQIASAGRELVLKKHSEAARAAEFEEILLPLQKGARRYAHFAAAFMKMFALRFASALNADTLLKEIRATHALLLQSAAAREHCDEHVLYMTLLCKKVLEHFGDTSPVLTLLDAMRRAYPEQPAFSILIIDSCLKLGDSAAATLAAAALGGNAQDLVSQAPAMVGQLEAASYFDGGCEVKYLSILEQRT